MIDPTEITNTTPENDLFEGISKLFPLCTNETDTRMYYARLHDPATHTSRVIPEAFLGELISVLEADFKTHITPVGDFLGFYEDLESIWWPKVDDLTAKAVTPVPQGIVGILDEHKRSQAFERSKFVFYRIATAPAGWIYGAEPGLYQIKPIREWILDLTFECRDMVDDEDLSTDEDTETEEDMPELEEAPTNSFPESVNYTNQVFID